MDQSEACLVHRVRWSNGQSVGQSFCLSVFLSFCLVSSKFILVHWRATRSSTLQLKNFQRNYYGEILFSKYSRARMVSSNVTLYIYINLNIKAILESSPWSRNSCCAIESFTFLYSNHLYRLIRSSLSIRLIRLII